MDHGTHGNPLHGLDDHPWHATSHAYGPAEDLPDLLRALASGEPDTVEAAVSELYGNVIHQGTVYAASVEAVPWLAALAAAGHATADLVRLLGDLAESEDEHGVEPPGAVRAAVAAQLPLLLPLLDAEQAELRQSTAWTAGQTRAGAAAADALHRRWERESDPLVRAELLGALARLDPEPAAALARTVLGAEQPGELRMAAVFVLVDGGARWDSVLHDTVLALLPGRPWVADRYDLDRQEPLHDLAGALLHRDTAEDREAALALVAAALADPRPEVRAEGVWAAGHACHLSRSAPARLAPVLVEAAGDPEADGEVLGLLRKLGPWAAAAAPALAAGAAAEEGDLGDRMLAALIAVDPGQAAPLLARRFERSPRALEAAAGLEAPEDGVFPCHPELLDAVRARLAGPGLTGNEPWRLAHLLRGWGPQGAAALPELYAALPAFPGVFAGVIEAVCPDVPAARAEAADRLRVAAGTGDPEGRLAAGRALHGLTGEPGPLLAALELRLSGGAHEVGAAAAVAGDLGAVAAPLVPALRAWLERPDPAGTTPALDADAAVATALWRITGGPAAAAEAVAVLDRVLGAARAQPWFCWTAIRAARCAALLGPEARPLRARLEEMAADPEQAPAAVLALLAGGSTGLDRAALTEAVLAAAEWGGGDEALTALTALGPDPDHPGLFRRLAVLSDGDRRVPRTALEHRLIPADERFRSRVRATAAGLGITPA
ncbi:hypothetical protein DEJ50_27245 [Streptomyces venezuelae]|uniref:PBS lyase n=1 Tax=Streptomyces venezuelae TaxID=54571 RepID=A0A5P2D8B4_STRVZ|nr:hypothetical protein [Streptomyces venezuelae]QES50983.1 hypothetical protein DEJ50_27245 [Streptomyces venezuelae]